MFVMATERAGDEQRARVGALAKRFDDELDISSFRRLDREFHTTIAAACGNPLLIELYGKVLDLLFRSGEFDELLSDVTNRREVGEIITDSSVAHRAIAAAFMAGDEAAVRDATAGHLASVEQAMVENLD